MLTLLDIDGVILPMRPAARHTIEVRAGHRGNGWCDPAILEALKALPGEIMWASDWEDDSSAFSSLLGHRAHLRPCGEASGWWKVDAIAHLDHPGVIVFVDDKIPGELDIVTSHLPGVLLHAPDPDDGLTLAGVARIADLLTGGTGC